MQQFLALCFLLQIAFSQPVLDIFNNCSCSGQTFETTGVDADGYILNTLPTTFYETSTAYGVLTSGDRSAFFSSTTEQLYASSHCYPTAPNCPTDPSKNFVFDYLFSTGAFASGDGAFATFGQVEVWDSVAQTKVTDSTGTTSAACTDDECTFRVETADIDITRKVYVHTADQQNVFSWARVIDTFKNKNAERYLEFKYNFNFGCSGYCFQIECADLGGIEAGATSTYLPSPSAACARTLVRGDTSGKAPMVGVVFQGTPPDSSQDIDWRAFAVNPTGDAAATLTTPPDRKAVGQEDAYMWFIVQTNPTDVASLGDVINDILTAPRKFNDDLDADRPFHGVTEEEWLMVANWESGVASLVPLFLLSLLSVFVL